MPASKTRSFIDLSTASIGRPITRLGISFFPVYLAQDGLPEIGTGPTSGCVVDELFDASVPTLTATNPTQRPVLLVEGEQFVGGDQNRTINVSVLVPAEAALEIPVSCLEQGRWGRRRAFQSGPTFTPRRVRYAKNISVARQAGTARQRSSDQGAVWDSIDASLNEMSVSTPTYAMAAADSVFRRERGRAAAVKKLSGLGPLPGQCGLVIAHGPKVVATEIFGAPELLRPHWSALVRSYLLERPADAEQGPSADAVFQALADIGKASAASSPGLGLGVERHVNNDKAVGQALTLDQGVVHASVLTW